MKRQGVNIRQLVVGQLATNCYLLISAKTKEAIVIDPGDDAEHVEEVILRGSFVPLCIVATHGHFDHVMAGRALQLAFNIPFYIHENDLFLLPQMEKSARYFLGVHTIDPAPVVTKTLADGEELTFGDTTLTVTHTPGHTPGSICLLLEEEETIFVGDTIFTDGAIGRTDFSYSRKGELESSIRRILAFPSTIKLLPGHGRSTTVGRERTFHAV